MSFLQIFGGGEGGSRSILQWIVFMGIFMFILPKLYFYQIFTKIEMAAKKLENISMDGQKELIKSTAEYGLKKKEIRGILDRFIDFFMISPVDLDPAGILRKFEHLIDSTEGRFRQVAGQIAPDADSEKTMDVYMGLQATVAINTIAKIVRHYVEMVKKFKNLQYAMILQMQLPMIEKLVEAERRGLDAFLKGEAVGDGIGPLVIASMLGKEGKEISQHTLALTENMWGRKITFIKARGPGGRLGKIGEAVRLICKKHKIAKIITIDAAAKLEGEKTGSVAEGIGVAIGGVGVQRAKIEEVATQLGLPIEAIAIKMSQFEAISPMPEGVVNAIEDTKGFLKERVEDTKKGAHLIVLGVGNTCGVPNTNKNLESVISSIKKIAKREKKKQEALEKGWFKKKSKTAEMLTILYNQGFGLIRGV